MAIPIGWTQLHQIHWSQFEGTDFSRLLFIILAGTFMAYTFNAYGIRVLGSSVTSAYIYIQLVFAVSIAVIFFGEHLTWQKVIAGIMILAGVYLVGMKKR
jgi:drug/metabolite transporter (DMT)-like permease